MEQKELVAKIFSVHETLRSKRRETQDEKDWDFIWKEHTGNLNCLQSMHELATKVWEPRNAVDSSEAKLKCRLDWVHSKCREYFRKDLEADSNEAKVKLKLLDVGSCFNPFRKYRDLFEITAIDLCPAPGLEDEVYQCDFLEVELTDQEGSTSTSNRKLVSLKKSSFDVVVFSFFLEYLPDKRQRLISCQKAGELLNSGGILFILRPDSGSVTPSGNSRLVKGLKVGCALLGLKRIFFEKLEHLWCMGFVKLGKDERETYLKSGRFRKDFEKVQENFNVTEDSFQDLFSISQDLREILVPKDKEKSSLGNDVTGEEVNEAKPELFDELPYFGLESSEQEQGN